MKLQSKKDKNKKILLIAGVALAVIVVVLLAVMLLWPNGTITGKQDTDITNIVLSNKPAKSTYFVGETFDPTGARIQVLTHNSDYTHFVDYTELTFSGFDSSVANDAVTITVSYKGFTTTFNVKVVEMPADDPIITKVEVIDFQSTYTLENWNTYGPSTYKAYVVFTYSDGSTYGSLEETPLKRSYLSGYQKLSAPGTTELTIKYDNGGIKAETTVTVTITN